MEAGDDSTDRYLTSESSSVHDIDDHHSKRSKTWSPSDSPSSEEVTTRSSKVTVMDHLPDSALVEILCRLPCDKVVSQSKCVSKRWCTLISDQYFIGRFLRVQIDRNQTPLKITLVTMAGVELLRSSSSNPLTPLFGKLVSFYGLEKDPVVVGSYNDLVLCCASEHDQREYYICNPYTTKWVPLPPPPQVYSVVAVGLMCDLPYYSCKKKDDDDEEAPNIQLNIGFRCRVMRIVIPNDELYFTKFKVQIFSFETGGWMEKIVSTPSANLKCSQYLDYSRGFAYNGMLYWEGLSHREVNRILIGLDPFMINNSSSSSGDDITDHYKCHFIELDGGVRELVPNCLGVYRGCLRLCFLDYANNESRNLHVWDLNEEDVQVGRLAVKVRSQENTMKVYPLDERMFSSDVIDNETDLLAFDLGNEDILYLRIGVDIVECNIRTKEWSMIAGKRYDGIHYFPIVRPWWPTPVPPLPQHDADP